MSDDFLERIATILGTGYHVERELGAGMSRVVVARDVALGRQVVVKVLPVDWAAGLSAERFRREVVLAAGLQHPHIVPLLAAAEAADGTPTTLVNATLGWAIGDARVTAGLYNVLGSAARDVQYFYASRLPGEPVSGVEDLHYHPVEPRQLRLSLSFGR